MQGVYKLLHELASRGGSDLHLCEGARPRMRIQGDLVVMDSEELNRASMISHLKALVATDRYAHFEKTGDLDFSWAWAGVARFRCNYFRSEAGLGAVIRLVPEQVIPFSKLRLPQTILDLMKQDSGLILLTGPTGSGKSTTLASMIDHINETRAAHIITIEDPIEFIHRPKNSFLSQREVGIHAPSFPMALKHALREDPDVLMIGELRDQESTALALSAAEMGFIVMATLHTASAGKTVHRIVDMFPSARRSIIRQQLASTLIGVLSQNLIKRTSGKGRIAAAEILVATPQLRAMIREGATHQIPSAFQQGSTVGCVTMDQAIMALLRKGSIDADEARGRLNDKNLLP